MKLTRNSRPLIANASSVRWNLRARCAGAVAVMAAMVLAVGLGGYGTNANAQTSSGSSAYPINVDFSPSSIPFTAPYNVSTMRLYVANNSNAPLSSLALAVNLPNGLRVAPTAGRRCRR